MKLVLLIFILPWYIYADHNSDMVPMECDLVMTDAHRCPVCDTLFCMPCEEDDDFIKTFTKEDTKRN